MINDLDTKEGEAILANNYIGHLAYIYQDSPFIAPITFYYDQANRCLLGYSNNGQKIDAMRINSSVSLQVEEIEAVHHWKSVLVRGQFEELHSSDAKYFLHQFSQGVKSVIADKENKQLQFISEFSSLVFSEDIPVIYKINIQEIIAKSRNG